MAVGNFVFFFLTALVAVNLIFAESEHPPQSDDQSAVAHEGPGQESNGRFWFFIRYRSCNYTAAPGSSCLNCYTAATCLPSNVGTFRVCRGFLPYCNAGRCSFIPTANCSASG